MTNGSNPSPRRGCLFYGVLWLAITGLLLLLLIAVGFYFAQRTVHRWTRDYTDTAPAILEKVEYSKAQMDALRRRMADFQKALDKGPGAGELVLTADDLNALVNDDRDLRGKVFVRIEEDRLKGEVSLPLPDLGPLKLNGRYLHGSVAFRVAWTNGLVDLRLHEVQVRGKPLPKVIFSELKKQNLALSYQQDPQVAATVAKFESIQVTNGQVILRTKPASE